MAVKYHRKTCKKCGVWVGENLNSDNDYTCSSCNPHAWTEHTPTDPDDYDRRQALEAAMEVASRDLNHFLRWEETDLHDGLLYLATGTLSRKITDTLPI